MPGGSGEWARLCTRTNPMIQSIGTKCRPGDELDVKFRFLPHHAELASPGAWQAHPQGPGGCSPSGAGPWGHSVLVKEGRAEEGPVLRAGDAGAPNSCTLRNKLT